ncbi:hypothetical protein [Bacillus cereus]|uniref:hypothetical protein n=1 Tax=Bacillus cereus TaxID=1396 RepID=UPI001C0C374C|nr:hypothetical protein [Bacillus cereus]QWR99758.1 hypothetical protein IMY50_09490 [Bacillus cereus]
MNSPYDFYITPKEYEEAEKNGISYDLLTRRVRNFGWDKHTAMTKPSRHNATGWNKVKEIALKNGISRPTYVARMKRNWRLIDAISKPPIDKYQALKLAEKANSKCQNKVLTDKQEEIALSNGVCYRLARDRIRVLKWSLEDAITTPPLTSEECGRRRKEASYWNELRL